MVQEGVEMFYYYRYFSVKDGRFLVFRNDKFLEYILVNF